MEQYPGTTDEVILRLRKLATIVRTHRAILTLNPSAALWLNLAHDLARVWATRTQQGQSGPEERTRGNI